MEIIHRMEIIRRLHRHRRITATRTRTALIITPMVGGDSILGLSFWDLDTTAGLAGTAVLAADSGKNQVKSVF